MPVKRLLQLAFCLLPSAFAGGSDSPWHTLNGVPAAPLPARPCPPMRLPESWDVRSSVYADVTGDGVPECVLSLWRPWRDWPIARWSGQTTPISGNRDAQGFSSHVAVLRPLTGGQYKNIWVGSALFQPVTALTVLPDGKLVTLETTYARGRKAVSVALSGWHWTGFGFRLEGRVPVQAREVQFSQAGEPLLR